MVTNNAANQNTTGFQSLTSSGVFNGRTLTAGTGISISNGDGISGNPVISADTPGFSNLIVYQASINMKVVATNNIFTTTGIFIPLRVFFYGTSVVGSLTNPVVNVGWTAASYNDLVSAFTLLTATGTIYSTGGGTSFNTKPAVPNSTTLVVNVTTADLIATTNTQEVGIVGYYL